LIIFEVAYIIIFVKGHELNPAPKAQQKEIKCDNSQIK